MGVMSSIRARTFVVIVALLFAAGVLCTLAPTPVRAATTYTVTTTTDTGTGSGSSGDLRYVVGQANANPGSTITFAPATNGQTITMNSELAITAAMTITGNGAANTLMVATNSTFSGNSVGVNSPSGASMVAGSTFSGNNSALIGPNVTLTDSIITASTSFDCNGITDGGHNLAYGNGAPDTTCTFTQSTSHTDRDPMLAPLAVNGALNGIQTFALLPGSPALDSGTCAYTDANNTAQTLATDARTAPRPEGTTATWAATRRLPVRRASPSRERQTT